METKASGVRRGYVLAALSAAVTPAMAATTNWSTGVSDSWSNPARWSVQVPAAGDTVNLTVTGSSYIVGYNSDTFGGTARAAGLTISNAGVNTTTLSISAANLRLGQLIAGQGAIVDAQSGATVDVGGNMNFNNSSQLKVAAGATVRMSATNTGSLLIGNDSAGSLAMTGGTLISSGLESPNARGILIGSSANGNGAGTANVSGGDVQNAGRLVIGRYSGTSGSQRTVSSVLNLSGAATTWTNAGNIIVGQNVNTTAAIGNISGAINLSGGTFTVSGASRMYLGAARATGTLSVSGGTLGTAATRVNEILVGTTFTGDPAVNGNGRVNLTGGAIHTNQLTAANGANSVVHFTGGSLYTGGTSFYGTNTSSGANFIVGNGVTAATLDLAAGGTGDHTFAGGLNIAANAALAGSGIIHGAAAIDGTLSAGDSAVAGSVGTIAFQDGLALGSGAVSTFDFSNPSLAGGTYDLVSGTTGDTVAFGGQLQLVFGGGSYADGSSVKIFDFTTYAPGNFSGVSYSGLAEGQEATFDPATGIVSISTVPEPAFIGLLAAGGLVALRRRRAR